MEDLFARVGIAGISAYNDEEKLGDCEKKVWEEAEQIGFPSMRSPGIHAGHYLESICKGDIDTVRRFTALMQVRPRSKGGERARCDFERVFDGRSGPVSEFDPLYTFVNACQLIHNESCNAIMTRSYGMPCTARVTMHWP
jgi:hypothetical protein